MRISFKKKANLRNNSVEGFWRTDPLEIWMSLWNYSYKVDPKKPVINGTKLKIEHDIELMGENTKLNQKLPQFQRNPQNQKSGDFTSRNPWELVPEEYDSTSFLDSVPIFKGGSVFHFRGFFIKDSDKTTSGKLWWWLQVLCLTHSPTTGRTELEDVEGPRSKSKT